MKNWEAAAVPATIFHDGVAAVSARGAFNFFGTGLRLRIRKVESEETSAPSAETPIQKPSSRRLSGAKEKSDASAGI